MRQDGDHCTDWHAPSRRIRPITAHTQRHSSDDTACCGCKRRERGGGRDIPSWHHNHHSWRWKWRITHGPCVSSVTRGCPASYEPPRCQHEFAAYSLMARCIHTFHPARNAMQTLHEPMLEFTDCSRMPMVCMVMVVGCLWTRVLVDVRAHCMNGSYVYVYACACARVPRMTVLARCEPLEPIVPREQILLREY